MHETQYDYVVIGAGIAGLSSAYHLSKDGHSVLVLEASSASEKDSASFSSTAEMNHDPDTKWDRIIELFGSEGAKLVWQLGAQGIDILSEFAHEKAEPHFSAERLPAYFYTYKDDDLAVLKNRYAVYESIGAHVSLEEDAAKASAILPSFKAVLTTHGEGVTNNQALIASLSHHAREHGAKILHSKKVMAIDGPKVLTSDGDEYFGSQVIVATGDGGGLLPETESRSLQMEIEKKRTFVVSYEKHDLPDLFKESVMWDTDSPYHYVRSFAGNRLWVGGEDVFEADYVQSTEEDEKKYARIDAYAREVLGINDSYTRQAAWSGVFYPAKRGLPYIGAVPGTRVIANVGFGGTGIITSFMSGYLLAAWKRGEMTEYQKLFGLDWK